MTGRKYDKTELARKDLVDMVRTIVRLKTRIAQRRELNEIENAILEEFDRRVAEGKPFELTYDDVRQLVEGRS